MFTIKKYMKAQNLDEAYEVLQKSPKATILGGGHFLKMGNKRITTAIDLNELGLSYIFVGKEWIEIGGTTTLSEIEDHQFFSTFCHGILQKSIKKIASRQLRNTAQIGASVYSKYSFSDVIPPLLLLNAQVEFYGRGIMDLEDYLNIPPFRDILTKIRIPNIDKKSIYLAERQNAQDFPLLNLAIQKDELKIVLGSRPGKAKVLRKTAKALENKEKNRRAIAIEEANLGSNLKCDKKVREWIFLGLLDQGLKEIAYGN
ncbi:MAG: FAD binding domain-containing protein [Tissierellia bacterium]|nr:FAD binding domain-containing protein [Tissierellia bacterium]